MPIPESSREEMSYSWQKSDFIQNAHVLAMHCAAQYRKPRFTYTDTVLLDHKAFSFDFSN